MEKKQFTLSDGLHVNHEISDDILIGCWELFKEVFKCELLFERFYNKHMTNPFLLESPISFFSQDNSIVGMNAFMGMYFKYNNTVIRVAQSCDTAVSSTQRGKGLFTTIVTGFEQCDSGVEWIFGIPNNNSSHGFLKMGFVKKADLTTMAKFNIAFFQKKGLKKAEKLERLKKVSFTDKELRTINGAYPLGFLKSNEYINYKLSNIDESNLKITCLRFQNELKGYIISHFSKTSSGLKIVIIDDWFIDTNVDKRRLFKILLRQVCKGFSIIKVPMINISSDDYCLLKECGFFDYKKRKKEEYESFIVSKKGANYIINWNDLSIRYIDSDTILN